MKYISIQSILFDLSLSIPEQDWDENRMIEWAIKGFRKLNLPHKYSQEIAIIPITQHKGQLPQDLRHITQVAYKPSISSSDIELVKELLGADAFTSSTSLPDDLPNSVVSTFYSRYRNQWRALQSSSNSLFKAINCQTTIPQYLNPSQDENFNFLSCKHEYHVDHDLTITTSFSEGLLIVSYLAFATDTSNLTLIPDDETLKEALYHYCLYRYWEAKPHQQASTRERQWHLRRYSLLSQKATANLNSPSIDQLESIKNQSNKLLKNRNHFNSFFSDLNSQQNLLH